MEDDSERPAGRPRDDQYYVDGIWPYWQKGKPQKVTLSKTTNVAIFATIVAVFAAAAAIAYFVIVLL